MGSDVLRNSIHMNATISSSIRTETSRFAPVAQSLRSETISTPFARIAGMRAGSSIAGSTVWNRSLSFFRSTGFPISAGFSPALDVSLVSTTGSSGAVFHCPSIESAWSRTSLTFPFSSCSQKKLYATVAPALRPNDITSMPTMSATSTKLTSSVMPEFGRCSSLPPEGRLPAAGRGGVGGEGDLSFDEES